MLQENFRIILKRTKRFIYWLRKISADCQRTCAARYVYASWNLGAIVMGIASRLCKERIFPGGVTGDRFPRRENLMEKSEVSDTDAPAIRQAIHGSAFAFSFSRERESQPGRAWEIYAGSNIRLPANNRCSARMCHACRVPARFWRIRRELPRSKPSRNIPRIVRRTSGGMPEPCKSPLWWNGVKELNRPLEVTNQLTPIHPVKQTNSGAHIFPSIRFNRWRRAESIEDL